MCIRDSASIEEQLSDVKKYIELEKLLPAAEAKKSAAQTRLTEPVSYTHLDVYKRQTVYRSKIIRTIAACSSMGSSEQPFSFLSFTRR